MAKQGSKETIKTVAMLASQIEAKNRYLYDLEVKFNETALQMALLEEDKKRLHDSYNEGKLPVLTKPVFFLFF